MTPPTSDPQLRTRVRCKRLTQGRYKVDVDAAGGDLRSMVLENEAIRRWCPKVEIGWRPTRLTLEVAIPESAREPGDSTAGVVV